MCKINNSINNPIGSPDNMFARTVFPIAVFDTSNSRNLVFSNISCANIRALASAIARNFSDRNFATSNPIEKLNVDGIVYFYRAIPARSQNNRYLVIQIICAISASSLQSIDNFRMADILADVFQPSLASESPSAKSVELAAFVRSHRNYPRCFTEAYAKLFDSILVPSDKEYFTNLDDVLFNSVNLFSSSGLLTRKFDVIETQDKICVNLKHNSFCLLLSNIMMVLSRYSLRTVKVELLDGLKRLEIRFKANFHNSFFMNNPDMKISGSEVILSELHPAFEDMEVLKRIANHNGFEVSLSFTKKYEAVYRVSISKEDKKFSNKLMTNYEDAYKEFTDFYVIDLPNI